MEEVLISPDLLHAIFSSLESEMNHSDGHAAAVCKAWADAWAVILTGRRVVNMLWSRVLPGRKKPVALAALPGGELLSVATECDCVLLLDKQFRIHRVLGCGRNTRRSLTLSFTGINGLAAGESGLYVAEAAPARVRRLCLEKFTVMAEATSELYPDFGEIALAPNGLLWVIALQPGRVGNRLLGLDALNLETRFTVTAGDADNRRFLPSVLSGLAVYKDRILVGAFVDPCLIFVLSLDGEPLLRMRTSSTWFDCVPLASPCSLCVVKDRIFWTEAALGGLDNNSNAEDVRRDRRFGRRLVVQEFTGGFIRREIPGDLSTPRVRTASKPLTQVYNSPKGVGPNSPCFWLAMCEFDGKLIVADADGRALLALQGL